MELVEQTLRVRASSRLFLVQQFRVPLRTGRQTMSSRFLRQSALRALMAWSCLVCLPVSLYKAGTRAATTAFFPPCSTVAHRHRTPSATEQTCTSEGLSGEQTDAREGLSYLRKRQQLLDNGACWCGRTST